MKALKKDIIFIELMVKLLMFFSIVLVIILTLLFISHVYSYIHYGNPFFTDTSNITNQEIEPIIINITSNITIDEMRNDTYLNKLCQDLGYNKLTDKH